MSRPCQSLYVTMRDGVRLAIDLHRPPEAADGPVPTILHQTRYFRSIAMRALFRWVPLGSAVDSSWDLRERFLAAGYAWVDVCVRGSGASFGERPCPWSELEIGDGHEILDWIVAQPWSDGNVGATGISYSGTSAEFLLTTRHPALRAIAPRFSCFDVYTDVAFPGGIHLEWFTWAWGQFNELLDRNDLASALALNMELAAQGAVQMETQRWRWLWAALKTPAGRALLRAAVRAVSKGVSPVEKDELAGAIAAHQNNYDVHAGASKLVYRDDVGISSTLPEGRIDDFSPHTRIDTLRDTGVPILNVSGWMDGGYAHAAIKRHQNLGAEQSQLLLGPWDHGGSQDISPFSPPGLTDFDHAGLLLEFFDEHLRNRPAPNPSPVRYYTLGAERWQTASCWPPPHSQQRRFYLGAEHTLTELPPDRQGQDPYTVDLEVGTGDRARWNSLLGIKTPIGYDDMGPGCQQRLCYDSAALRADTEVTGHPLLSIRLQADQDDVDLFALLLDVDPSGRATYVTEGQLRARHRKVSNETPPYKQVGPYRTFRRKDACPLVPGETAEMAFDLHPISYLFSEGHTIRLALAGADANHFAPGTVSPPTIQVHWGGPDAAYMDLPIVRPREPSRQL